MNKPRIALNYLKTALKMEKVDVHVSSAEMAATYLNLCAVYSELGHHTEAINKALKSVMLVKSFLKKQKA